MIPLKRFREQAGLSQTELAVISGVKQQTISQIENGQNSDPQMGTVLRLAMALKVSLDELVRGEAAADG